MGRLSNLLVVIDLTQDPKTAHVHAPYRANAVIKAFFWKARRWDSEAGCWLVDAGYVPALVDDLVAARYIVDVHDAGGIHTDIARNGGWSA